MSRCYLLELLPEQLESLSPEQLELATQVRGEGERQWLLFRDSLIAYKVAMLTGSTVRCGQMVTEAPTDPLIPCETLVLGGGAQVRLEVPLSA